MCYSAQVIQSFKRLRRQFSAQVDYHQVEQTFRKRIQWPKDFQISRAVEFHFDHPQNPAESRIKALIDEFRDARAPELEKELFAQKRRLVVAERQIEAARAIGKPPTKKAMTDQRVATNKIEQHEKWLKDLRRTDELPRHGRIFSDHFAPIIVRENGINWIRLARYHLRRRGNPASFDAQYEGLHNARRDNLEKFWSPEFGKTHACFCIESFFENVERDGVKRVAHFTPSDGREMTIACLYSEWGNQEEDGFLSFAAITDIPPPEVSAAGHDRIIINLDETVVNDWLAPAGRNFQDLQVQLDQRARPYYGHELLAA
jgi:putative SOS response-associated peptidase YedK